MTIKAKESLINKPGDARGFLCIVSFHHVQVSHETDFYDMMP